MNALLVLVAVIIFTCVLLNNASFRIGMPVLLAFILLGILFGNNGIIPIDMNIADRENVGDICTVALIFIMFYGGFGTSWKSAKPIALEAGLLASVGVICTAALVGVFCHFLLKWGWIEALLLGSVVSSTDAASVFSIFRSRKLGLKNNTAPLLEMESGSNDPCSYMLTIIMLSLMQGEASVGHTIWLFFAQLGFGALFGVLIARVSVEAMKRINFATAGFDSLFVLAIALFSYAVPGLLGGNGYLSAYIVGIILGNTDFRGSDEDNMKLSEARAASVVEYLVSKGINPDRLTSRGMGESNPVKVTKKIAGKYPFLKEGDVLSEDFINALSTNQDKEICHQLNRRSEFAVMRTDFQEHGIQFGSDE